MPIQNAPDSQKVDYLWKKIVYGAAKTDISGNIDATNEPVASPLLIRGDKILQQSDLIANIIPGSNSSVVTVYPTTLPVECTSTAGIPTPTLTWQTGRTFWIPPEFGSTYQIKVYISPSGQAGNVLTKGTQVFATGSGNNDLWVFDYQSGILNFNSNNTPYNASNQPISFTGNSVYISGAVYSGQFGLPTATSIGNITFSNTTISTSFLDANIYISPTGNGTVQFGGNLAVGLPVGDDTTRPTNPQTGYLRFNTFRQSIEYWDGVSWNIPGEFTFTSDIIYPDGAANTFPLTSNSTATGVMVSINGTTQQPYLAYDIVNNNQIQFTEIPLTTDVIDVRHIAVGAISVNYDTAILYQFLPTYYGNIGNVNLVDLEIAFNDTATLQSNVASLQANAYQQQALIGNLQSSAYSNVNVSAYLNSQGYNLYSNANVASYLPTYSGNVSAQYFAGNGSQLTGIVAAITPTYETISNNLSSYPYIINRSGTLISNVVYTVPGSVTITKEFSYSGSLIQSIAIFGTALSQTYTKNLTYVGTSVSGASYSVY